MISFMWRERRRELNPETKVIFQNAFYDVLKGISRVDNFTSAIDDSLQTIEEGTKEELINFIQMKRWKTLLLRRLFVILGF